tara:strand:+ start:1040 stop:1318 length:279 start_codon:yes stop_codon:yes gene_type:complete
VVKTLGINPIQFGIIMVLNLCIGLFTLQVGSILFVGIGLIKTNIEKVIKPLLPLFFEMIFSFNTYYSFPSTFALAPQYVRNLIYNHIKKEQI